MQILSVIATNLRENEFAMLKCVVQCQSSTWSLRKLRGILCSGPVWAKRKNTLVPIK